MISARILGTGSALAGRAHPTSELVPSALPGRDAAEIERRTGIRARRFVPPSTRAADLGAAALTEALAAADLPASALARLIFVSSTGGDHLIPATANAVAEAVGIDDTCDAFDVNNACTGFLTALDLAARSIATGLGPVAVVAAELFSRYLPPDRARSYLVMGDAAGAAILGQASHDEGFVATSLKNNAFLRGRIVMDMPGEVGGGAGVPGAPPSLIAMTGAPPRLEFRASYEEIGKSAIDALTSACRAVTAEVGIVPADVEWFLPHQPNGRLLSQIADALGVPWSRLVPVADELGSVGAASIPVSLDRLMRAGRIRPGDRILFASVGAGTAYGATLYRVAS